MAMFREWHARPIDLPGTYYLQVAQWLHQENRPATGLLVALRRQIDLSTVRCPIFLLAAHEDEIVAPAQVMATRGLVGRKGRKVRSEIVAGAHLGLFMGATNLLQIWPKIGRWLAG